MPTDSPYTIADLARLTGLNVRTIRYYLAQGLLPASGESGPGAHYGEGHLDRLRLTKRLQTQHLPLAEIRRRLAELTDADVASLATADPEPDAAPTTSALEYVRNLLGGPSIAERSIAMPIAAYAPPGPEAGKANVPSVAAPGARPRPPLAAARSLLARARYAPIGIHSEGGGTGSDLAQRRQSNPGEVVRDDAVLGTRGMPRMRDVPATSPTQSPEQAGPERSQWERLALGPNVELHVRRPLSRLEQRRVERLITIARQVLDEDQS